MRVEVTPTSLAITPGEPAELFVTVYNTGEVIEGYRVALVSADGARVLATAPDVVSLFPDSEGSTALFAVLPTSEPAGLLRAVVRVTPTTGDEPANETPVELTVARVPLGGMAVAPQSVTGGGRARFSIVAENRGNVPLTFYLSGTDPEHKLWFHFAEPAVEVPAGRRVMAAVAVKGRRPALGAPVARLVTFHAVTEARSGTPEEAGALEAAATFVQKPWMPRAVLTLAAVLLALGLWSAVLFRGVDRAATEVASEVGKAGTSTITGIVTDGQTGIGGVEVTAAGSEVTASTTSLTAGEVGSFKLKGLVGAETYVLTFAKDGYAPLTYEVPVPAGEGAVVSAGSIVLGRGSGVVSGTVTDADGKALGGVGVTVSGGEGAPIARAVTAESGALGFYSVGGLGAGTFTVTFERFGFVTKSTELAIEPGQVATLDTSLVASAEGSISGLVSVDLLRLPACRPGECPLSGVTIEVTNGTVTLSGVTASSPVAEVGRYEIRGLPAGSYTVTFARDGYQSQVLKITLGVSQAVSANVKLRGVPGAISGTAAGCTNVEARHRDLTRLDPSPTAVPGTDGSFTLGELRTPGAYTILFEGPENRAVDVNLGPGEQRTLAVSCLAATTTTSSSTTSTSSTTTTVVPVN